jgi:type VI secretion system protein ImpL
MKRIFSWLLRPAVLSLIGVTLLSLVIWFEGPLLAFDGKEPFASSSVRWFLILCLFLIWAGYFLYKLLAARLANARLMARVASAEQPASPGAQESAAEVAALSQRLQEAMDILRKSSRGKRGQYLYQLPWYMFVGAPGAGKTTALVQSGLNFPLADKMGKNALGGIGGTRNCDWWFTDEAVLLDTAGRYTTQDSYAEVDHAAWRGFLQMLRQHRRRRPINGVILAVSVADLLQQTEAARQQQAQAIRARIKDLHEQLGLRFPIYVMLTKCDLLAGFTEFFDDMGREERAQVWGMTFGLSGGQQVDQALTAFPEEFQLLEHQLQTRLLERMQRERDVQRRGLIYSFPQQFASMGKVLHGFLKDVFQSTRYEETALLRGVYFTSGTQEGNPIDRVMGAMAAAFGLPRQALPMNAGSGRSYFITRLLREVIFAEAEVAGVNVRFEKRRRLFQWGAMAGIGVLMVLAVAGLLTSYARNSQLIDLASEKVGQAGKLAAQAGAGANPVTLLPLLDALRELPAGYAEHGQPVPVLMRLGLYQGGKLGAGAEALYLRTLRATLLPRIVRSMEEQLRRGAANSPDYLYEVLRVYVMLGDPHFDEAAVAGWVEYDNRRSLAGATEAQREALDGHVRALMKAYRAADVPVQLDAQLISDTRLALARMPLPQRVYNSLKHNPALAQLPEFSATAAGGRDAPQVFARRSGEALTRGVPGMYSVAGYLKFQELSASALADVSKDSWVLARQEAVDSGAGSEQMRAALLQLYYTDYITEWDRWLADLGLAPFSTLDQGARMTNLLSGPESPLRKLLQAAARETTLEGAGAKKTDNSMLASLKDKSDAYKKRLENAMGAGGDAGPPPDKVLNPVDQHFDDLHKLAAAPSAPGAPAPLDPVLAMLKEVAVYLDAAAAAKRGGSPAPPGEALVKLKREADGKPAPLAQLLKNVDSGGAGLTLGSERERLNALWTAKAAQFCRQAIAGRYPLVRSAAQEVTQDDFGKFFAPGGLMDEFFQQNLLPYVDMGSRQWRWRANADKAALGIPQEALDAFQRAAQVRDAYFGGGGRQPSMRFELKLISADPALIQALLDIDGQPVPFGNPAALRPVAIQLPSGKGSGLVRLETTPASSRSMRAEGAWPWLRMIDQGVLEASPQAERFKLTFDIDGHKLVYGMTASSVINPFRREALEQFRCMERL